MPSVIEMPSTKAARNRAMRVVGWASLGLGIVAAALYAGYEIRLRRFRNRTPYEMFGHAGDDTNWMDNTEYGVGI